jgi:hypothetical protein
MTYDKTTIAAYAASIAQMEKEPPTGDWLEVSEAGKLMTLLTDLREDLSLSAAQKGVITRLIKRITLVYSIKEDAADMREMKQIEAEEMRRADAEARAEARRLRSQEKEVQVPHKEMFVNTRPAMPGGKEKVRPITCWCCGTKLVVEFCTRCQVDALNPPPQEGQKKVMSDEELKTALIDVTFNCEILPQSKVTGQDFRCNPAPEDGNKGLQGLLDKFTQEAQLRWGTEAQTVFAQVDAAVEEKVQQWLDEEEGLNTNREVDDLEWQQEEIFATKYGNGDKDEAGWEREFYTSHIASVWASADAAQARHDRMVTRLAILDEMAPGDERRAQISDDFVELVLDDSSEDLKALLPSKKSILKKEREVLMKDNASYFRIQLEEKAFFLRALSFKAEDMQGCAYRGEPGYDGEFVRLVCKLARRTELWAKAKAEAMSSGRKVWSKRALYALYNEAVHVQVALGVYKTGFFKKEYNSEDECSFFIRKTREGMVEVKSGLDWAEELRTGYYEASDGNRQIRHGNMMD